MLLTKETAYSRRPSAAEVLVKSSRPMTRKPWQAAIAIACIWLVYTTVEQFRHSLSPSLVGNIKAMHAKALSDFETMKSRQSTTLLDARAEYQRRYGLQTPPLYDEWYNFAVKSGSHLIDEFDDLMEDLRPYHHFFEASCDQTANKVMSDDIVRICVEDHQVIIDGQNQTAVQPLVDVIGEFAQVLPNLCVAANTLEQPRTVLGHAMLSSIYGPNPPKTCEIQRFTDLSKHNIWKDATLSCASESGAKNVLPRSEPEKVSTLVSDWKEATDLCSRSKPPRSGLILSPEYMRISNVVRPILSVGSFSTYHDIRYPGPHHLGGSIEPIMDHVPWEEKKRSLGWRGDSSGGWNTPLSWHEFQRQAMVMLASPKTSRIPATAGRAQSHPNVSPFAFTEQQPQQKTFTNLLDIEFTDFTSCDPVACEVMQRELGIKEITAANEPLDSRLVLSMDGGGADPDFYTKLKSNSAVLRQGIVREWHDERLVPWLHYIPLSMDNAELGDIVQALLGDGEAVARAIADASRTWAMQALRKVDQDVYIYRLLIEMARFR